MHEVECKIAKKLWVEAVNYACFITHQSQSAVIDFKVLEEA